MEIKSFKDIFQDILLEGQETKEDMEWWAGLERNTGLGRSLYLAHPETGLYHIKTYQKNPMEVKGVGGKITTSIDEERIQNLRESGGSYFGVIPNNISDDDLKSVEKIINQNKIKDPIELFRKSMEALGANLKGSMSHPPEGGSKPIKEFKSNFKEEHDILYREFKKILNEDEVFKSYI